MGYSSETLDMILQHRQKLEKQRQELNLRHANEDLALDKLFQELWSICPHDWTPWSHQYDFKSRHCRACEKPEVG